jgi:hypothetical protein
LSQEGDLKPIADQLKVDRVTREHLACYMIAISVSMEQGHTIEKQKAPYVVESLLAIGPNTPDNGFPAFGEDGARVNYTLKSGEVLHAPACLVEKYYSGKSRCYTLLLGWAHPLKS